MINLVGKKVGYGEGCETEKTIGCRNIAVNGNFVPNLYGGVDPPCSVTGESSILVGSIYGIDIGGVFKIPSNAVIPCEVPG